MMTLIGGISAAAQSPISIPLDDMGLFDPKGQWLWAWPGNVWTQEIDDVIETHDWSPLPCRPTEPTQEVAITYFSIQRSLHEDGRKLVTLRFKLEKSASYLPCEWWRDEVFGWRVVCRWECPPYWNPAEELDCSKCSELRRVVRRGLVDPGSLRLVELLDPNGDVLKTIAPAEITRYKGQYINVPYDISAESGFWKFPAQLDWQNEALFETVLKEFVPESQKSYTLRVTTIDGVFETSRTIDTVCDLPIVPSEGRYFVNSKGSKIIESGPAQRLIFIAEDEGGNLMIQWMEPLLVQNATSSRVYVRLGDPTTTIADRFITISQPTHMGTTIIPAEFVGKIKQEVPTIAVMVEIRSNSNLNRSFSNYVEYTFD
ncbi:MAG: hypothetical protein JSW39_08900 [Desulfobacterales bacterium]|nr:MAG: hypothetical protein JSW39_08900 [Desulfobacterales bacterium]